MYVCLSYLNADIFALLFTPRSFQVSNQGPDFCYCIPGKYLVRSSKSLWVRCPLWVVNTLLVFFFFLSRTLGGVPAYKKKEKAHCERCRHTFLHWRGHHNTNTKEHTLAISSFVKKLGKKKDVDKCSLHLPAASDVENTVQQSAGETKSGCGQTLCIPGMIIAALHWLQFFFLQ